MTTLARAAMILALLLPVVPTYGSGAAQQDSEGRRRESPDERNDRRQRAARMEAERARQAAALSEMRARAVSMLPRTDPTGIGNPARDEANGLNALVAFATELQGLVDLRSTEVLDDRIRGELRTRSETSLSAARRVLDSINRGSDVPPAEPVVVPEENLGDRLYRLAALYWQVAEPTVEVISGDVLDAGALDEVRSGFAMMEALIEAVPESQLAIPPESAPVP